MPYPEYLIAPMRGEMTDMGAQELRTPQAVDEVGEEREGRRDAGRELGLRLRRRQGAAGHRDGAAQRGKPDVARDGLCRRRHRGDRSRARSISRGYAPSSPSIGLLQDGKLIYMMERREIETRDAEMIAEELTQAFDSALRA